MPCRFPPQPEYNFSFNITIRIILMAPREPGIEVGEQLCSLTYVIKFISLFNIKFEELIECYDPIIENLLLRRQKKQEVEIEKLIIEPEPLTSCFSK